MKKRVVVALGHRALGTTLPEQKEAGKKYVKQNITMDPEQLESLVVYCQKEDRPMSWVIRKALEMYLLNVA